MKYMRGECILLPESDISMADYIMTSLYFDRFRVPDFVTGTPEIAKEKLSARRQELLDNTKKSKNALDNFHDENAQLILHLYNKLLYLSQLFEVRKYAAVVDEHFYVVGFVPTNKVNKFKDKLLDMPQVLITTKPPETDLDLIPPTKLKNGSFAKPFTSLVEMYGLPGYHDINPTFYFAFIYCLLFGIMFGDIGQGLVICLIGILMQKVREILWGKS